jgi:hypothetical protein
VIDYLVEGEAKHCSLGSTSYRYQGGSRYIGLNVGNAHLFVLQDEYERDFAWHTKEFGWFQTDDLEFRGELVINESRHTQPPLSDAGRRLFSQLKGPEFILHVYNARVVPRESVLDALLRGV